LSNVISPTTASCTSGHNVFCDEDGLMAGGGDGGDSDRREQLDQSSVRGLRPKIQVGGEAITSGDNSLSLGASDTLTTDVHKLSGVTDEGDTAYQVELWQTGGREAEIDRLTLGAVDHAINQTAFAGFDSVLIGTTSPVVSILDDGGTDLGSTLADSAYSAAGG